METSLKFYPSNSTLNEQCLHRDIAVEQFLKICMILISSYFVDTLDTFCDSPDYGQ